MILTMPLRVESVMLRLEFDIFYLHTKFGDSRFRYIIAGIETDSWSCVTCDPDQAFFKDHSLPVYKLPPFQVYGWCSPKFKWFTLPDHSPFRDGLSSVG